MGGNHCAEPRNRYLRARIERDLARKMVFVAGREVAPAIKLLATLV